MNQLILKIKSLTVSNKNNKFTYIKFVLPTVLLLLMTINSCKKLSDCFDQELYDKHKNDICTMDCPGVRGCNGKIYCNECSANSQGIRINK